MLANRFQRLLVNLTIPVECFYLTPSHIVDECRAPSIKERDPLAGLLTMIVMALMTKSIILFKFHVNQL